jgi:hypothetical protein
LVVGAAAALVVVGAAVVAVVLAMGGGEGSTPGSPGETPSPEPTGQSQAATPATPSTASASPTPSVSPTGTASRRFDVPNGSVVPGDSGLLYIDLATGAMEFWSTPGSSGARPISRDGRWVVWGAPAIDSPLLLDTATGNERPVELDGRPAAVRGFSLDGRLMAVMSDRELALVQTESGAVLARAALPASRANGSAEFAANGAMAAGFGTGADAVTVVLRPDGASVVVAGGWPMRWSHDGERLAVTTVQGLAVVDPGGRPLLSIERGAADSGFNPRWSPDDRYIAIAHAYDVGGQRVFESATGAEVVRSVGTPTCLGDYWFDDGTLQFGWEGERLAVPSGQVLPPSGAWPPPGPYRVDDANSEPGLTRLLLSNSVVEFRSGASSWYYDGDGIHSTTTTGKALFLIGVGGKGLCDAELPNPAVSLPPFDD